MEENQEVRKPSLRASVYERSRARSSRRPTPGLVRLATPNGDDFFRSFVCASPISHPADGRTFRARVASEPPSSCPHPCPRLTRAFTLRSAAIYGYSKCRSAVHILHISALRVYRRIAGSSTTGVTPTWCHPHQSTTRSGGWRTNSGNKMRQR